MAYKKNFNLNPADIDVIETCLRNELHIRTEEYHKSADLDDAEEADSSRKRISEISDLLGKIHNQKIWFDGDPGKPHVPKG